MGTKRIKVKVYFESFKDYGIQFWTMEMIKVGKMLNPDLKTYSQFIEII